LFGGNRSLGGINAQIKHAASLAAGNPILFLAKRKYSGKADKGTANYKCPNCSNFYHYPTPRETSGHKRKHQRCGGKSQVLVPYHAVH
jgi:hypothetical protein